MAVLRKPRISVGDDESRRPFLRTRAGRNERYHSAARKSPKGRSCRGSAGNLRYYQPDFVALANGTFETRGLEDVRVANKDRAARLWYENTTRLTCKLWTYVKVLQTADEKLQSRFEDLSVLGQREPLRPQMLSLRFDPVVFGLAVSLEKSILSIVCIDEPLRRGINGGVLSHLLVRKVANEDRRGWSSELK